MKTFLIFHLASFRTAADVSYGVRTYLDEWRLQGSVQSPLVSLCMELSVLLLSRFFLTLTAFTLTSLEEQAEKGH